MRLVEKDGCHLEGAPLGDRRADGRDVTIYFLFVFEWGKTLKEVKPGLFLASNQILMECQEKQQLIKRCKVFISLLSCRCGRFHPGREHIALA